MKDILFFVANNFKICGEITSTEPYGSGHINTTYIVITKSNKYIIQKINSNLFTDVEKLMKNIALVSEHIRKYYPNSETLTIIKTKAGKDFYKSNNDYYRIYKYIDNSICLQIPKTKEQFYESALGFGNFSKMLSNFNAKKLYEVIPNFHNTLDRYNNFVKAVENNIGKRKDKVAKEIEFVIKRKNLCDKIIKLLNHNVIPVKVTHNDTKLNNVLLNKDTYKYLAVIDLDTVMPGSICFDFGDSIRFGCNTSYEDEQDLNMVHFNMEMFEAFANGYLKSLSKSITLEEKNNLSLGAIIMTYECGMRFLTDYLNGDKYFNISRENQNLDRCKTQVITFILMIQIKKPVFSFIF